jgi:membrane protein
VGVPTVPAAGDPEVVKRTRVDRLAWTGTTALSQFSAHRDAQISAAISYHVLFAIVPLFTFLGTIFGLLLNDPERRQEVTDALIDRFPLSPSAGVDIERILSEIPTPFSLIGVISIVALLWSASGMMSSVRVGLTAAFDEGVGRPFFRSKLVDVLLVISVGCLFIVFLALTVAINAVERWSETVAGGLGAAGFDRGSVLAVLVSPVLTFGVLLLLYRLVPRTRLRFRDLAVGAGAAAIASEAIRIGFSYYLARVARYDLLYGALGSVFAFLLVVYLQAIVLLLGAEIACAWAKSAYGPREPEPAVPLTSQARNAIRGLFVRSEKQ